MLKYNFHSYFYLINVFNISIVFNKSIHFTYKYKYK